MPALCRGCNMPMDPKPRGAKGRPPDYHPACAHKGNRSRRLQHVATVEGPEAADALEATLNAPSAKEKQITAQIDQALQATEPVRMAICLSVTSDIKLAAALAGLRPMSAVELATFAASVRASHADLIARRPAAVGALVWQAMALNAANLLARANTMPPAQSAAAIKSLAQTLELVQGGTTPAYSQLIIEVLGPEGAKLGDAARVNKLMVEPSQ